jgi:hypothetical protein
VKHETTQNDLDLGDTAASSRVVHHGWAGLCLLEPRPWARALLAIIVLIVFKMLTHFCPQILIQCGQRDGRRNDGLCCERQQTRRHRQCNHRQDVETKLRVQDIQAITAKPLGPVHPLITNRRPIAAALAAYGPLLGAVALFQVKQRALGCVDDIRANGSENADNRHKDPALCAVKPRRQTPADVFSTAECLDAVGVGNVVVHPVGRGELVVPDSVVLPQSRLRGMHAILQSRPPVTKGVDEPLAEGMAERPSPTVSQPYAGGQLTVVSLHTRPRGTRHRGWDAQVRLRGMALRVAQQTRPFRQVATREIGLGATRMSRMAERGDWGRRRGGADGVVTLVVVGGIVLGTVVLDAPISSWSLGHGGSGAAGVWAGGGDRPTVTGDVSQR